MVIREEIQSFTEEMEKAMVAHNDKFKKTTWRGTSINSLYDRLVYCFGKLSVAWYRIKATSRREMVMEACVDLANLCMMVYQKMAKEPATINEGNKTNA